MKIGITHNYMPTEIVFLFNDKRVILFLYISINVDLIKKHKTIMTYEYSTFL